MERDTDRNKRHLEGDTETHTVTDRDRHRDGETETKRKTDTETELKGRKVTRGPSDTVIGQQESRNIK